MAGEFANYGTLDYVAAWYIKAAKYMIGTNLTTAFVSTNSIAQGEHVASLWKPLFAMGIQIVFARRTFRWDSEASLKAHVHCVIVGFTGGNFSGARHLWSESGKVAEVSYVNGYLLDAPDIFIEKRSKPWRTDTPIAQKGNAAMDNGFLVVTGDEAREIAAKDPVAARFLKRHMSADDFLNGTEHYCIWLRDANPSDYQKSKEIMRRIKAVQDYRNSSNRAATKKMAAYPMLFAEVRQPDTNYIMLPVISSERLRYVPIAYLTPDVINSYASISIPNATLYHFGVLTSIVHNAWMRALCGRLKSDYRYSTTIVYNNFPWPTPTVVQQAKIEQAAQAILDARTRYPGSSLAVLYDEVVMPP